MTLPTAHHLHPTTGIDHAWCTRILEQTKSVQRDGWRGDDVNDISQNRENDSVLPWPRIFVAVTSLRAKILTFLITSIFDFAYLYTLSLVLAENEFTVSHEAFYFGFML